MNKLLLSLATLLLFGCQKETFTEPTFIVQPPCYNTDDLTGFLSQYGGVAADIIPTVPGDYFQDANCGIAKWIAETRLRDENGLAIATGLQPLTYTWTLDTDPSIVTETPILPFYTYTDGSINTDCPGIFQPSCNGSHLLEIRLEFADGTIYSRSGTAYGQVNGTPVEICQLGLSNYIPSDLNYFDFDTFSPIEFEPYQFLEQGLEWDLNNDGSVNTSDLNIFLAGFGDC